MKKKIGLFGFGVVGEGFYNLVVKNYPDFEIVKIVVKDVKKHRSISSSHFTDQPKFIIEDPDIEIIVELINDSETAYQIVKSAILKGKHVISANKKMIAGHLEELDSIARAKNVKFLYEAAVGGSIPILRNLDNYYIHDDIDSISGIINGSTNFILDLMTNENENLNAALRKAQDLGFAESDASQDIEGFDATNKLKILVNKAFGIILQDEEIIRKGISSIRLEDLLFAHQNGLKIKLIARAEKIKDSISAGILPQFVGPDSEFYNVTGEFNAITIHSHLAGNQTLKGKGAGRFPTALAVIADLNTLDNIKLKSRSKMPHYNIAITDYIAYLSFPEHYTPEDLGIKNVFRKNSFNGLNRCLVKIDSSVLLSADWLNDPDFSIILFGSEHPKINEMVFSPEEMMIPLEKFNFF